MSMPDEIVLSVSVQTNAFFSCYCSDRLGPWRQRDGCVVELCCSAGDVRRR